MACILKNSWGENWGESGFCEVIEDNWKFQTGVYSIQGKITSQNHTDNDIVCEDRDGDGYYNWGVGPKPATCPCWALDDPDGDDSNPNLGPMNEFGYCLPIEIADTITTSQTWSISKTLNKNITIPSGVTLTITSQVQCEDQASITILAGGQLIIDGGTLTNICTSSMWQGITVLGDSTQPMQQQHQGYVKILNYGKIENALCALHVMGGGMVETDRAYFSNNIIGLKFEPLASGQSGTSGNFLLTSFVQEYPHMDNSLYDEGYLMEKCGQVFFKDCRFFKDASTYYPKGIAISNTTVDFSHQNSLRSIPIDLFAGATVTVSGEMFCSKKITVYPAGKLVIKGELSNYNNMSLWDGIDVLGDGTVQITNGGTIKNAKTGITAINGAIVNATNANFVNNSVGVHFKPTATQIGTSGTFSQTEFVITGNHVNPTGSGVFLKMDSCMKVSVTDCSFSSSAPLNSNQGVVVTNASTLWTGNNQLLSVPVSLFADATLTNTGTIMSNENTDITVFPDGNLIIDGGIFTNATANTMWKGVIVQGDLLSIPAKKGVVELQNGGIIKNALLGIHAFEGGSVTATDAKFTNNKVGVQMEQGSDAIFTNTQFNINMRYPGNNLDFATHLKLFNSNPATISGCKFVNETNQIQNGGKANNGIQNFNTDMTCLNNSFFGFCNAISASNSGRTPNLSITNCTFSNNTNGIRLNGINYPSVRDNQLAVNVLNAVGIYNGHSTGYTITENSLTGGNDLKSIGVIVENSGEEENMIYKNYFHKMLLIGIQAIDVNSSQKNDNFSPKSTGLQFLCNKFSDTQEADIVVGAYPGLQNYPNAHHSVRPYQGSLDAPAGNDFLSGAKISIANYSNYDIYYVLDKSNTNEHLKGFVGTVYEVPVYFPSNCPSLFDKNSIDLEEALTQYDELNDDNFFNSIIVAVMDENSPSNFEGVDDEVGRGSLYETLRYLFNYRGHYTDYLSVVETYLAENNFDKALETLAKMYEKFELTSEQVNEVTSLQVYVYWLQQLEKEGKNIYELSEKELDYLINYVTDNTGRGVVFAHNILCELYDICIETESRKQKAEEEKGEEAKGEEESHVSYPTSNQSALDKITLVPNPTTGELRITNYELGITDVEIFDIYGKQHQVSPELNSGLKSQISSHLINIAHLPTGLYFVKITTKDGVVVEKVIKN